MTVTPIVPPDPPPFGVGLTFAELRTELRSRMGGKVRWLSNTRVDRYLNLARAELDDAYYWPYLQATITGTAPVLIPDLGDIEAVQNTSSNSMTLQRRQYRDLVEWYEDLTITGNPLYYYLTYSSGLPSVAVYPANTTDTLSVRYWKVSPDLSESTDQPLAPAEYHGLILDLAQQYAYRSDSHFQEAEALQHQVDRQLNRMWDSLRPGLRDGPDVFQMALDSDA